MGKNTLPGGTKIAFCKVRFFKSKVVTEIVIDYMKIKLPNVVFLLINFICNKFGSYILKTND